MTHRKTSGKTDLRCSCGNVWRSPRGFTQWRKPNGRMAWRER